MVTRSAAWPEGTPCWVDLAVADVDKAIEFYTGLFGWDVEKGDQESGFYSMCGVGGKTVAGIGAKQSPEQPTVWTTFLAASDVDKTAGKVTEAGGQVLMEPFDVMDSGRMAMAVDPTGAAFGVWQANKHIGAELANEPSSLVWNEQMSRDLDGATAFYAEVFGYTYDAESAAGSPYAMLKVDGAVAGGLGTLGPDTPTAMPAHWRVYFSVANTDAAAEKVTALGGRVISPPADTPYGRQSVVSDDQDAMFVLIQGS
ncbi:MAG: VOC family protein [Actinophytocola sp.]|uniref:VOC family protein n=1 Tax=Actinophytocola sp. TaxID=1872138 RepID=UPI001327B1DA|nr:VOC family protein [Actinophytocola sp.]MPZ83500.1 VOC family protein [Actinophytocola sp.]